MEENKIDTNKTEEGRIEKNAIEKSSADGRMEYRIGVLDGIRAISIGLVVWFHFWQQTWLTPYIEIPVKYTEYIGITEFNLAGWVRMGFIFVDMMILLSAFCNFYPYARAIVLGENWPDTRTFYVKRAARILPSYYFMLAMNLFFYILPEHKYQDAGFLCKDIVTHILCIAPNRTDTYLFTAFNGVLWTVQIEVIYYLLMPWIARLFRKWTFAAYSIMLMISVTSTAVILNCFSGKERNYANNILTFMGIYANGMLCCILYVMWKKYVTENKYTQLAGTVISVLCIFLINGIIHKYDGDIDISVVQLKMRLVQSFLFALFIFSTACAWNCYQKIYSNRFMSLFCKFSYNLYLWHQLIAVWLKEKHIPYWSGENPPNMTGDRVWQWKYQILILVASAAVAVAVTVIVEIPARRYLLKCWNNRKELD